MSSTEKTFSLDASRLQLKVESKCMVNDGHRYPTSYDQRNYSVQELFLAKVSAKSSVIEGKWDKGTIHGEVLKWPNGDETTLIYKSPKEIKMTLQRKDYNAA